LSQILRLFFLPPGLLIEVCLLVVFFHRRKPRLSRGLAIALGLAIYLLSMPLVSDWMQAGLDRYPVLSVQQLQASRPEAIVVLSSGGYPDQVEVGGMGLNSDSLQRTYYGVYLHRQTGLPLLFSGSGWPGFAVATAMGKTAQDMGVDPKHIWLETESKTTYENALLSERFLKARGLNRILLVTQHWHMRRAVYSFSKTGLEVTPAPFNPDLSTPLDRGILKILPSKGAFFTNCRVLEEWLGMLYYAIRT
jgi:uncharacterized SAM-binding protein YcdF (DUF218 family)